MDVEWLKALNKSRQNKALMELEESMLEKAISHIENKVFFSFPYRFPLLGFLLVTLSQENEFSFILASLKVAILLSQTPFLTMSVVLIISAMKPKLLIQS